jgi:hypothetical protein
MALDHSCQTGTHPLIDRGRDSYPTPRVASAYPSQTDELLLGLSESMLFRGHSASPHALSKGGLNDPISTPPICESWRP